MSRNWKVDTIRKLQDERNDARDLWLAAIWGHIPLLEIEVVKNKPPHHGIQRLEITVMEVGNGRNNWPPSSPDHRNQDLNGRVTHQGPLSPATAHVAGMGGTHTHPRIAIRGSGLRPGPRGTSAPRNEHLGEPKWTLPPGAT